MDKIIKDITIAKDASILQALMRMDAINRKLLIVINNDFSYFGLVSIGDIQRAIINNQDLTTPVSAILRDKVMVASVKDNLEDIKNQIRNNRNDFMPVIDEDKNIINVIFWEDLFKEKKKAHQFTLPVVIMAGGKGSRLKPLTNVIPKPLIPILDKTIIENIMDRFVYHGCHDFYLSVNYKADMLKYYLESLKNPNYCLNFFQEELPLGTAGSLSLIKNKINTTFFVSNCDILIDEDYSEILKYHQENKNLITLVAALKTYPIPYGTIETGDRGQLLKLEEKPELTFKINTGMYILEPEVLDDIPENNFFHITQLMEILMSKNGKIGVFPVSDKSWIDIGNWETYKNYIKIE